MNVLFIKIVLRGLLLFSFIRVLVFAQQHDMQNNQYMDQQGIQNHQQQNKESMVKNGHLVRP